MDELIKLDDSISPGDFIKYFDEYGEQKGFGFFVKKIIHPNQPLTKSRILVKSIKGNKMWSVNIKKFDIMYKKHQAPYQGSDIRNLFLTSSKFKEIQDLYYKHD
uniref:Uncharacterized protein n=1 Tax=Megaviridae environmental sample TaxID=1737588 RepID=A0A5J6VJD3_9VIRU|nr:MAG: hypothetical protein [Megaviridae environmental sample]